MKMNPGIQMVAAARTLTLNKKLRGQFLSKTVPLLAVKINRRRT
jgi:hypothetical protein